MSRALEAEATTDEAVRNAIIDDLRVVLHVESGASEKLSGANSEVQEQDPSA